MARCALRRLPPGRSAGPLDVFAIGVRVAQPCQAETSVTPEQQSFDLYEKAGEPKKLVLYKKTTHYGIYNDYFDDVAANVVDWYKRHLKYDKVAITEKKQDLS